MSDSAETPWSNDPNAPQIPSLLYRSEKAIFAGIFIGAISYGVVVVLFFQCMSALLSPANHMKGGVKWALVAHTVAALLFLTIHLGISLAEAPILYINDREFPGNDEYPPGPIGYNSVLATNAATIVYYVIFPLNQWLADGLLVHRCYVIYSMNRWAMAFPCLMYLASVAMGIAHIYQASGPEADTTTWGNFNISYISISLSLNILLTLMIVMRLILHSRSFRKAIGASDGPSDLYTTVAAMIIESYALYATVLLLYVICWAANSWATLAFTKVPGTAQVIAPYLIILRVAKRRALTSDSISETAESIRFRSQGTTDGEESLPGGDPTNLVGVNGETSGEPVAGNENAIEEVPL